MYVRFVVETADPGSDFVWSLFGAVRHLQETGELNSYEHERLDSIYQWFKKNLKIPDRLARSDRAHAEPRTICWFKSTATECIEYVRELVEILKAHDIAVQMMTGDRLRNIVC